MADIVYAVDGVSLQHPFNNWYLLDDRQVSFELKRRSLYMGVEGLDGAYSTMDETDEPTMIGFKMSLNAANGRTAQESYQALMSLLTNRVRPVILTRTFFDAVHSAEAKFVSSSDLEWIETHDSFVMVVVMSLPGVYWRDPTDSIFTQTAPVSGTDYRVTTLDNSAYGIRDALIKLTGPMTLPVFRDLGSGGEITLPTITAGRQVVVDCERGRAWEAAASGSYSLSGNDITAQMRATGPGSSKRVITLTPTATSGDPFDRRVNVRLTTTGLTGASKLEIKGRRVFL